MRRMSKNAVSQCPGISAHIVKKWMQTATLWTGVWIQDCQHTKQTAAKISCDYIIVVTVGGVCLFVVCLFVCLLLLLMMLMFILFLDAFCSVWCPCLYFCYFCHCPHHMHSRSDALVLHHIYSRSDALVHHIYIAEVML